MRGCGVQDASLTDPRFVAGLTHGENRGEGRSMVGKPGLAGSDGDNLCGRTLAPACPALLGGGTACWWERSLVPKACSPVAHSNPFSICLFIYYLLLSLALFFVSWFPMLLAWEGSVLWGTRGQQQTPLYCSSASLPCRGDRSVWHAQLIKFFNIFPSWEKGQNPGNKRFLESPMQSTLCFFRGLYWGWIHSGGRVTWEPVDMHALCS